MEERDMSLRAFAFLLIAAVPALAQRTWRVPGNAASINEAARLASPGDRILLTSPNPYGYGADVNGIDIDKALTIEPLPGQRAGMLMDEHMAVAFRLHGLGGGARFVLRNFDIVPLNASGVGRSRLGPHTCLEIRLGPMERGTVVLDDVVADGLESNADNPGPALVVNTGAGIQLQLRNCTFRGATGNVLWVAQGENGWQGSTGGQIDHAGPGLIQDCVFEGGDGGYAWWWYLSFFPAKDGGPGLVLRGNDVALVGGRIHDGDGGWVTGSSQSGQSMCAYVGQPGQSAVGRDPFDVLYEAGAPGSPSCSPSAPTPPPIVLGAGRRDLLAATTQPASTSSYAITARALTATQGQSVLLFGTAVRGLTIAGFEGRLYLEGLFWSVPITAPGSGGLTSLAVPGAAGLTADAELALQLVHLYRESGKLRFGNPSGSTLFVPRP